MSKKIIKKKIIKKSAQKSHADIYVPKMRLGLSCTYE